MISLEIQKYVSVVQETTENANKELKMGRDLEKITKVWQKLNFEFEIFDQAGGTINILKGFDVI